MIDLGRAACQATDAPSQCRCTFEAYDAEEYAEEPAERKCARDGDISDRGGLSDAEPQPDYDTRNMCLYVGSSTAISKGLGMGDVRAQPPQP